MGAKVGAQLAYMDTVFGNPYFDTQKEWQPGAFRYDNAGSDAFAPRGFPHSLMVNHKGRRFCDESTMYDTMNRAFGTYDTGTMEYVNIPGYWICDSTYTSTFLLPGYATPDSLPEFVFKFDTLEELADGMGIDKEALQAEIAAFNENAAQGADPVWHRGEKAVSANTMAMMSALMTLPGATAPQSVLGTVDQPPFYCCRYVPGMMGGTRGGLHINENAQVLDVDGEPIGGLYATGNCSSGVAGYWAGGATLGQGSVMSALIMAMAVSYTHLDVYKRQSSCRRSSARCRCAFSAPTPPRRRPSPRWRARCTRRPRCSTPTSASRSCCRAPTTPASTSA